VGSNYVWGWESNRIARELIELSEGQVLGEKYFRFGCTDFIPLIITGLRTFTLMVRTLALKSYLTYFRTSGQKLKPIIASGRKKFSRQSRSLLI